MKKKKNLYRSVFAVVVVGLALSGCGSARQVKKPDNSIDNSFIVHEVRSQLVMANNYFEAGEYEKSIRICDDILTRYQSDDKKLEVALLTNMALASLELGDRENFLRYADEVESRSKTMRHLPRNTQLVLSLVQRFKGDGENRDLRVNVRLHETINSISGGE